MSGISGKFKNMKQAMGLEPVKPAKTSEPEEYLGEDEEDDEEVFDVADERQDDEFEEALDVVHVPDEVEEDKEAALAKLNSKAETELKQKEMSKATRSLADDTGFPQQEEQPIAKEELKVEEVEELPADVHEQPRQNLTPEPQQTSLEGLAQNLTESPAFKQVMVTPSVVVAPDGFADLIEANVQSMLELHGITNLSLEAYGIVARSLTFKTLQPIKFGNHLFLGRELTSEERTAHLHRTGLYVAQSNKRKVRLSCVVPIVDAQGITMYSLQYDEMFAKQFATIFKHKVSINPSESDVSKLEIIIEKMD